MSNKGRSLCLISSGLYASRHAVQPWHYLFRIASQLAERGYRLTLITDRPAKPEHFDLPDGMILQHVPSVVNPHFRSNRLLQQAIIRAQPDLILWHLDLTTFRYQRFAGPPGVPVIGLVTSPMYVWDEVAAIGRTKLMRAGRFSAAVLYDVLMPRVRLRRLVARSPALQAIVVQTQTSAQHLESRQIWSRPVHVIAPGVDPVWYSGRPKRAAGQCRASLGFGPDHKVVLYHAQPLPYRGLERFLQSFVMLHHCRPTARLLVIKHDHPDAHLGSIRELERGLALPEVEAVSQVVIAPADGETLATYVAAVDAIAFPYQLLQTDAPLHLLQARALAIPVVTTNVGCMPELVGPGAQLPTGRYGVVPLASALDQALYGRPHAAPIVPFARSWKDVGDEWVQLLQHF